MIKGDLISVFKIINGKRFKFPSYEGWKLYKKIKEIPIDERVKNFYILLKG
jgi:hypothetical protein